LKLVGELKLVGKCSISKPLLLKALGSRLALRAIKKSKKGKNRV